MEYVLIPVGIGLCYFLIWGVEPTVRAYMGLKAKIAEEYRKAEEAKRDTKQLELEIAKVVKLDDYRRD